MASERLIDKIERLAQTLERLRTDEYLEYVSDKKRMLFMAFAGGAMRGVGFMFGFSIIGALAVTLLKYVVLENIPGIGGFLAEVVNEIEMRTR